MAVILNALRASRVPYAPSALVSRRYAYASTPGADSMMADLRVSGGRAGRYGDVVLLVFLVHGAALAQGDPPSGDGVAAAPTSTLFERVARQILETQRHPNMRWSDIRDVAPLARRLYDADSAAWRPLWLRDGRPTRLAASLSRALARAEERGLRSVDYDAGPLAARLAAAGAGSAPLTGAEAGAVDLALTANVLRFAYALRFGRVSATAVHAALRLPRDTADLVAFVRALLDGPEIGPEGGDLDARVAARFDALEPPWTHYRTLRGTLRQYRAFAAGTTPLPPGLTDSIVEHRLRRIELSLERWRWLPHAFAVPPIFINIPAFRLHAFGLPHRDDAPTLLGMNVAVGRAYRTRTPVFSAALRTVIFAPYWDVPLSIARAELLPRARRDPAYLVRHHMEIVSVPEGRVLPLTRGALAAVASGAARIRQRPGPDNALGGVKFVFPNDYNVYLHDTPVRATFALPRRDVSHGCIRVAEPARLAAFVLRDRPEWTAARIDSAMRGGRPLVVPLVTPIPVFIVYATVVARTDGRVMFYDDIYGHDRTLARVLARGYPYM